jgi:hypothetical protein
MSTKDMSNIDQNLNIPKSPYKGLQINADVVDLLIQVEGEFKAIHGVRPSHSETLFNALNLYRAQNIASNQIANKPVRTAQ